MSFIEKIERCLKLHLESLKPSLATKRIARLKGRLSTIIQIVSTSRPPQKKQFLDKIPKVESIGTWSSQGKNSTCNTLLCITLGSRCLVTWPNVPLLCMAHLLSTHWYPVTSSNMENMLTASPSYISVALCHTCLCNLIPLHLGSQVVIIMIHLQAVTAFVHPSSYDFRDPPQPIAATLSAAKVENGVAPGSTVHTCERLLCVKLTRSVNDVP